ncbi:MAG TPA: glycosyltransferase [Pyrinomonadaceae bacterium]|jgi:glycosyltransferase involved in cell wall biosynthesis
MIALEKGISALPEAPGTALYPRTLYLSFDGLLEPLGRSQVLSYLLPLSRRGFPYTVISLERERDLENGLAVEQLEHELSACNICWIRFPFHTGGVRAVLKNCRQMYTAAREAIQKDDVQLIHARSYVTAMIARILRLRFKIPYIFDMRGYWVDELKDEGRWFTNMVAYQIGKRAEKRLVKDAAAIVTLTQIQADDLRHGLLSRSLMKPVEVITTCASYEEFNPSREPSKGAVPAELAAHLRGKLVVGLIGSINASYRINESVMLFRYLLEERRDAHLICLTRQLAEMKALLNTHAIPESAYTLATVPHSDMADWLRLMDWALLLLNTRYSKRGSMPTKLAEFFAAGVRPIQYGCNEEVSEKIREAGTGVVLDGLSAEDLQRTAHEIARTPLRPEAIERARDLTRAHFSLEAGVDKYAALLSKLYSQENS